MCQSGRFLKNVMFAFVLRGYLSFGIKQQIKYLRKTKHQLHLHKCFLAVATIFFSACDQTGAETPVIPARLCLCLPVCLCLRLRGRNINRRSRSGLNPHYKNYTENMKHVSESQPVVEIAVKRTAMRPNHGIPTISNMAAILQRHFQGSTAKPTASRRSLGLLAAVQGP